MISSSMTRPSPHYRFQCLLPLSFAKAEKRVRSALQMEKFGVISEIDIQAKLQEKLGIVHPQHKILGACNPQLAYKALQDNMDVALALPCNVVLLAEQNGTIVSALRPSVALKPFQGLDIRKAACSAEEALARVFDSLRR